jgi:hypothetical protein
MTKRLVLMGALVSSLASGAAWAQARGQENARPARRAAGADQGAGHTAPKPQPNTAPAPTIPSGDMALGTVRVPKGVKADGKPLPAGTYQVRLTAQTATPPAAGQTAAAERWAEFVQSGQVKGREVVTIVPQAEIAQVQKDAPPRANAAKVETLKGGDYVRVWINKGGNHYLIHLPV